MLVSDFYVVTTTSRRGSKYDDFFSQSISRSSELFPPGETFVNGVPVKSHKHPYPTCALNSETFTLPTINTSVQLPFAQCRPSKFGLRTLWASGSTLGLAPSETLSQTGSSLLKLLLEREIIQRPIFSLMLINGQEGILSIGGTAAKAVEMIVSQTETALDRLEGKETTKPLVAQKSKDLPPLVKRERTGKRIVTRQTYWEEGWVWNGVQGAEGWWQLLMRGVWVDGSRVLRNQAVVIDVSVLWPAFHNSFSDGGLISLWDYHRSTAHLFSPHHSRPKPSTPQYQVRARCRRLSRTSTSSHV